MNAEADEFVQRLNNQFADPSGGAGATADPGRDALDHIGADSESTRLDPEPVTVEAERA